MTYKIRIKTLDGNILTFRNVDSYTVESGFIIFKDQLTGKLKQFAVNNSEVEEEMR